MQATAFAARLLLPRTARQRCASAVDGVQPLDAPALVLAASAPCAAAILAIVVGHRADDGAPLRLRHAALELTARPRTPPTP